MSAMSRRASRNSLPLRTLPCTQRAHAQQSPSLYYWRILACRYKSIQFPRTVAIALSGLAASVNDPRARDSAVRCRIRH
jgi:hypothetical protein